MLCPEWHQMKGRHVSTLAEQDVAATEFARSVPGTATHLPVRCR